MIRRLTAAAVGLVLLAGCGSAPTSGTVVDRTHADAYTKTTSTSTCSSRAKDGTCRSYMPQISTRRIDAVWKLLVQPGSNRDDAGWREVTEDVYNQHPIGSHYECGCKS